MLFTYQHSIFLKPIISQFFASLQLIFSVVLLFITLPGHAANTLDNFLTWHSAMTLTMERNPSLIAYGYQLTAQEGRLLQAGLRPNPELAISVEDALGSNNFKNFDAAESTLNISWILEGKQRRERISSAKAQTAVLEVQRDIGRLDAVADTAGLYIAGLALQMRQHHIQQAVSVARKTVEVIRTRVAAGNSPAAELSRARIELSRLLLEEEDIQHQLLVNYRKLAAQWGSSQPEFSALDGTLDKLPKIVTYSELQNRLNQNPRLQYFATKARVDESYLALAKAQARPQWRVSVGVKHLAVTDDQALVAGVSVPLGVFDRQQGRIAEARALMELNRAEAEAETIRLQTALFDVHQELLHSLHVVNTYRKDILPALEQSLVETRRAYDLGRYSFLEWQSVQRDYLDTKNLLIDASVTAHLNAIEIERLTGVTPRTDKE